MAQVDPTYLVGVIREKEKKFLGEDEHVRIMGSKNLQDASKVLIESPYGVWLTENPDLNHIFTALYEGLLAELNWLKADLNSEKALFFITARYDALNITRALIDFKEGKDHIESFSRLGSLSEDLLFSLIWNNTAWETAPKIWKNVLAKEHAELNSETWTKTALFIRMEQHLVTILKNLAFTPLMKKVTALTRDRLIADHVLRNLHQEDEIHVEHKLQKALKQAASASEIATILQEQGYTSFNEEIVNDVQNQTNSVAYEKAWDQEQMKALHEYRLQPSGYDPVISYWFGKEAEVKMLRILFSAKSSGLSPKVLDAMRRPFYQYRSI